MHTPDRKKPDAASAPSASPDTLSNADTLPGEALGAITLIAARRWQPSRMAWIGLFVCLGVVAFWSMLPGPSLGDHECYVAQTAKEMRADGDWVIPHFSGMPRLQKGPLAYWCVVGLAKVAGRLNDGVVRLPSGLAGLALAAVMAALGKRAFGTSGLAWFAAAVTGFSGAWLVNTHNGTVDMQETLWCTLAGAFFWLGVHSEGRGKRIAMFAGMGLAFGMAMLAKMPMPAAVLLPAFLVYLIYLLLTGHGIRKVGLHLLESLPGLVVMLLVCLPWIWMVLHRLDSGAVGAKWYREFISRYEGDIGANTQVWYYYGPALLWMILPWTLWLPEALAAPFLSRYRPWRDVLVFALCLVVLNVIFFSSAGYKRPQYILPAVPWLLLLLTPAVWRFFAGPVYEHPKLFARLGVGLSAVSLVGCGTAWLVVWHQDPEMAHRFAVPTGVMAAGLISTGMVLALRARIEAVYILLLTITVTFCFGWTRASLIWGGAPREQQFAGQFRQVVPAGAAAYYVGRPDARLVYYGQLTLPRVLSDLQLERDIQARQIRRSTENSQVVTALALIDLFKQDKPVYAVGNYSQWNELQTLPAFVKVKPQLLYHQTGFSEQSKDWVVIANHAAATTQPLAH